MLSRSEREDLVLHLYYNQGKNVREMAQETRKSFRDVGAILKKAEANSSI
jgi:DNA-directed RNA polymerase specialized sigma subunit